jgi:hypothetical protein
MQVNLLNSHTLILFLLQLLAMMKQKNAQDIQSGQRK